MADSLIHLAEIPAELASAIVAAQTACDSLRRDAKGDKGKYTTSDAIAAEAGRVLNENGAAWVRTGVVFEAPGLSESDIGNQSYVGDLVQTWMIVHKGGAAVVGTSRMPVITSRGRPPDKATAASLTYDVGQVLRGALCMEREGEHSIDRRKDNEDSTGYQHIGRKAKAPRKQVDDGERADVMRALDSAVGAYAQILGTSKQVVFTKAAAHMRVTATVPADLDTDAARACERVVMERIRSKCTETYKALCELDPDSYSADAWQAEWSIMAGLDTWPERPSVEEYAAVYARMSEIALATIDGLDPTDGGAP